MIGEGGTGGRVLCDNLDEKLCGFGGCEGDEKRAQDMKPR